MSILRAKRSRPARLLLLAAAFGVGAFAGSGSGGAADAPAPADLGLPPGGRLAAPVSAEQRASLRDRGLPFGPGERLRFSIEYGPIKAGTATLEVKPMRTYRRRSCYHFVSEAASAPFFDRVFKVRDRIDSLVDGERFVSWQYRKAQREGSYRADHEIIYDHENRRARYAGGRTFAIPESALDVLGAFYLTRLQRLEVGDSFFIPHHSDRKSFYLQVRVHRREHVQVPAGTFDCLVVEPLVRDAGPFKHQGRLTIWLTDDARRVPVLMKSKVPVGSIAAVLQEFTYGRPPALAARSGGAGS